MPHIPDQRKNQHILWRAAFGTMPQNVQELRDTSPGDLYGLLVKKSARRPDDLNVANNLFDGLVKGVQDVTMLQQLTVDQKKMLRKQSVDDLKNLNLAWLGEMIGSEAQLREKTSLFWHGHFACRVINIYFQQQLLNIIRENALGNFGDLLRAVSKSAAMLTFLNNQQNRRQHPNENFAREVMELFTIGRGHYTENDVKEGARAFTGWGCNLRGEFVTRPFAHDNGTKTFFGKTGNFDGDDIIDILLEQEQTARFITQKIYTYFVNDTPDPGHIDWLAGRFYQRQYDIGQLLADIFGSEWFYEEKNRGARIKSPVELLVGIRRFIPLEPARPEVQLLFQRTLGQVLFYPPNVAGWPGGRNWIDSSSLMFRLRMPQILAAGDEFVLRPKEDDDTMMGMEGADAPGKVAQLGATVDWDPVIRAFQGIPRSQLREALSDVLLQVPGRIEPAILDRYAGTGSSDSYLKTMVIELMSTPEYQLC